ncbi:hypothetical protein JT163_08220, partial [Helicobacter pylori]|nr:hypothetical protein [Helicobacter pylori]
FFFFFFWMEKWCSKVFLGVGFFFFQEEDGISCVVLFRGLENVDKKKKLGHAFLSAKKNFLSISLER